jgi:hypothetical protein
MHGVISAKAVQRRVKVQLAGHLGGLCAFEALALKTPN